MLIKSKLLITPKGEQYREIGDFTYQIVDGGEIRIIDPKRFEYRADMPTEIREFWRKLIVQIHLLVTTAPAQGADRKVRKIYADEVRAIFSKAGLTKEMWQQDYDHALLDILSSVVINTPEDKDILHKVTMMYQATNSMFGGISHVGAKSPTGTVVLENRIAV